MIRTAISASITFTCFLSDESPDDLAIVDCIEFNERFRAADPLADMAFLVMDLIRHGYREPARWFRDAYLAAAGDQEGRALVPFYVSYRAAVRAKVNGIKSLEAEVPADEREKTRAEARAHWLLAMASIEECRRASRLGSCGRASWYWQVDTGPGVGMSGRFRAHPVRPDSQGARRFERLGRCPASDRRPHRRIYTHSGLRKLISHVSTAPTRLCLTGNAS